MGAARTGTRSGNRRRWRVAPGVAALVLGGMLVELGCAGESSDLSVGTDRGDEAVEQPEADQDTGSDLADPGSDELDGGDESDAGGRDVTSTALPPGTSEPPPDPSDPVAWLRVEPESDGGVSYDRDDYGGWTTGADGCRTRDTVLIRDARPPGAQVDPYGCRVLAGEWTDPYTNEAVFADDPSEVSDLVHVDHVVALAEAHRSGAWRWSTALRRDFANDLDNLLATAASVNISKSDRGPSSWQPPALDRWCRFTEIWILTKVRWDLAADPAEVDALGNMRSARSCPDDLQPAGAASSQSSPTTGSTTTATTATTTTTTAPPTTAGNESCTPGYDPCIPPGDDVDCAGGSGNGPRYVEGPVQVDHAHGDPYGLDRDGDGVACA